MVRTGFVGLRPSLPEGSPDGRHWSSVAYQLQRYMQQETFEKKWRKLAAFSDNPPHGRSAERIDRTAGTMCGAQQRAEGPEFAWDA
jgi:hypothetical protein